MGIFGSIRLRREVGMMRRSKVLLLASLLLALASPAIAQSGCGGQFGGGTVCGNPLGSTGLPGPTAAPVLGKVGLTGQLGFFGSGNGTATVKAQTAAGTPTLLLPNTSGTFAAGASAPIILNAITGNLTCPTCVTGSGGALINGTTPTSGYTNTQILSSNGSVLSAYSVSGSGNVVLTASPTISGLTVTGSFTATGLVTAADLFGTTGSGGNVVLATAPTVSTLTVTGSFAATGLVTNADLVNPSTTVNGQTCTLGSTCIVTATASNTLTFGTHLISGGSSYNGSAPVTITSDATSANTASTIVARDPSGNFTAGTITASLTGHASLDCALSGCTMAGVLTIPSSDLVLNGSGSGSSTVNAPATGGGTVTLFAGTDTVVGKATTDTFTNKTITSTTNVLGGVTMTLGSDASGDIYYRNSSGFLTRLPIGSSTNVMTVSGGLPAWTAAASGGTVTSIATTSPITGGTITTTGTIACATCVTSAASLSSGAVVVGAGSQASAATTTGTGVVTAIGNNLSAAGGLTTTIASGATALATGAIGSAACATAVTGTATNTATTDVVLASFNGDPTAVTGYVPLTTGMLTIIVYPTSNTVNFKVCNNTGASITPGAITLNWRVVR